MLLTDQQFKIKCQNKRRAVQTNERKGKLNIYKQTSSDSKLREMYSRYRQMFMILLDCFSTVDHPLSRTSLATFTLPLRQSVTKNISVSTLLSCCFNNMLAELEINFKQTYSKIINLLSWSLETSPLLFPRALRDLSITCVSKLMSRMHTRRRLKT